MAKIQKTVYTKCSWCCRTTFMHCWWKCKMVQPVWKKVQQLLLKLNRHLPHDPVIAFQNIYSKEIKTYSRKKCVKGCLQQF